MSNKNLVFNAAVRGFHVYKTNWKPQDGELLKCAHEEDNLYDIFSMKVCKIESDEIVGHLPMEISRITKFIVDRGAMKMSVIYYRRSPLVQGGLEVPCNVTITMIGSVVNHLLLTWYKSLLKELYIEPNDEEIVGIFLSLAQHGNEIGEIAEAEPRPRQSKSQWQKRKKLWMKEWMVECLKRHLGHVQKTNKESN